MPPMRNSIRREGAPSDEPSAASVNIGSAAALISFFVIISRITGFLRTWAMAFALGSTMLASSYQVANNLPEMLYEMVIGGMLVTAFLPVYVSVKERLGEKGGNDYASNLLSITFVVLGIVALVCTFLAPQLIYTQSFLNDQSTMGDAIFFFRFFSMQILFYGLSSIVSGLLNASRDYLWSSAAPIFNNVIVTTTFVLYAFFAQSDPEAAKLIIAIGNPLGIFVQMAIQIPALRRNGIRIRPHIDLKDPALIETLSIGVPATIVMVMGLAIVSVKNAASYNAFDNGPSIIAYARLWYTLPYSFLTVPITTAMFTEIAEMFSHDDLEGFKRGIVSGTSQIIFFMVPFAMYLAVFAAPLVTLYHIGAFSSENILQISSYLAFLALALPLYGVSTYLQKAFSALRRMGVYAAIMAASAVASIAFTLLFGSSALIADPIMRMAAIALAETVQYVVIDIACFVYLKSTMGSVGIRSMLGATARSLVFGALGSAAALGVMSVLESTVTPLDGSIPHALVVIAAGGIVALAVTFGGALALKVPESAMLSSLINRLLCRIGLARP